MKKVCKECGKLLDISCFAFSAKNKDGREGKCRKCRQNGRKSNIKICPVCGKKFRTAKKDAKYCSRECLAKSKQTKIKYKCDGCDKEIEVLPSELKRKNHIFCSNECYRKHIDKCISKKLPHPRPKKERIVITEKVCKSCGKLLSVSYFTKSKNTVDGYEGKCKKCRLNERKKYIRTCLTCGKQFITAKKDANYCSNKCSAQTRANRIIIKCFICGKEKEISKYEFEHHKHFYCSEECQNKGYSKLYTGENNFKYSQITVICENCGKKFKRVEKEVKRYKHNFCSTKCMGEYESKVYVKENSFRWDPNKTDEERISKRHFLEYSKWRKKVYKRDNYTCQCCGDDKGHNLRAHHILNYSEHKELGININNGITLCKKCHKKFHDTYGYTHNNAEQLKQFFENEKNKSQLVISDTQEIKLLKEMLR